MTRVEPPQRADELTSLEAYLDYQRETMAARLAGLTAEQATRPLAPSPLTLAGLVKHLALVEDTWFQERLLGRPLPEPWAGAPFDDDPDWEFHSARHEPPGDLLVLYARACDRSRAAVAALGDPGALSATPRPRTGEHFTLRWMLLHMIEETARHNGHADLIRESIDGVTGE
jgi:uncharacterized damage-inducible protein DinB